MATVSALATSGTGRPAVNTTNVPYKVEMTLDFAAAATAKGSALAASDVIQTITVPAESVVLSAGWEVVTAMTGTSTDATLDFGVTGGDVDNFVDGFDLDGAAVGAYSAQPVAYAPVVIGGTADTLDILIATQTGTITGGSLRVWAVIVDVSGKAAPGATR